MTPDAPRLAEVLSLYAKAPMRAGDAVLVLDGRPCMEIEGLADHWDDVVRRKMAHILCETARGQVMLAIARPDVDLSVEDYRIWRERHQALSGSEVDLLPLQALPAA